MNQTSDSFEPVALRCPSCAAPLGLKTSECLYCGTLIVREDAAGTRVPIQACKQPSRLARPRKLVFSNRDPLVDPTPDLILSAISQIGKNATYCCLEGYDGEHGYLLFEVPTSMSNQCRVDVKRRQSGRATPKLRMELVDGSGSQRLEFLEHRMSALKPLISQYVQGGQVQDSIAWAPVNGRNDDLSYVTVNGAPVVSHGQLTTRLRQITGLDIRVTDGEFPCSPNDDVQRLLSDGRNHWFSVDYSDPLSAITECFEEHFEVPAAVEFRGRQVDRDLTIGSFLARPADGKEAFKIVYKM